MYKFLFLLVLFINFFINKSSSADNFNQNYKKIDNDFETCVWSNINREYPLTIEYDLYDKLNLDTSPYVYNCNKMLKFTKNITIILFGILKIN